MKSLLISILLLFSVLLFNCTSPISSGGSPQATPTPVPIVIPPPTGLTGNVKAVFYDGSTVKFWDGTNFVTWKTGAAIKANTGTLTVAVDQVIYQIAADGSTTSTVILPNTPKTVTLQSNAATSRGLTLQSGADIWSFADVTTAEKQAAGNYLPSPWTHVYKNATEIMPWFYGAVITALTISNNDVIVIDNLGHFTDLTTDRPYIENAIQGGPLFWRTSAIDLNFYVTTANGTYPGVNNMYFDGFRPPWQWWLEGTKWFCTSGAMWSEATGYVAAGSKLTDFRWPDATGFYPNWLNLANTIQPRLVYMGDAGGLSYLTDATTGWLIILDTSTGLYTHTMQVFMGDTTTDTPSAFRQLAFKPVNVAGTAYFHLNGTIWTLPLSPSGAQPVTSFMADQQMWVATL